MYEEDELLPISALAQLVYCERRCALIHLEGLWEDNLFTVEGSNLHARVHEVEVEMRGDIRTVRDLRLASRRLGLSGKADVVEFHRCPEEQAQSEGEAAPAGVRLEGQADLWTPYPVEYKRGRPRPDLCYEVQLCAQALCLEEMLKVAVPRGALFFGKPRRRQEIALGENLRRETEALCVQLHELIESGLTPPAQYNKRCRNCSLLDVCMPKIAGTGRSARAYLDKALADLTAEERET